eukprot:5019541-Alexandrium_andersonii.AAC.1
MSKTSAANIRKELKTGKNQRGRPLTSEEIASKTERLARYENSLARTFAVHAAKSALVAKKEGAKTRKLIAEEAR